MSRFIKWVIPALLLVVTVLEALPFGAVLKFATEEGTIIYTYSYFSLTPFGFANFAPLISGIFTALSLLITVILLLKKKSGNGLLLTSFLTVATATSLAPLLYGKDYFNAMALTITVLLALILLLSVFEAFRENKTTQ